MDYFENYKFEIIEQEIMEDHVHLFISAPPSLSPGKIISIIKSISGREIFMLY
ncbi:MAG: transposase, partial [Clostridium sp.]|nr:transposase [Clostridium sp.]